MNEEAERDLEKQVNQVFEDIGGSLLNNTDRSRGIDHLLCHPFFVGRGGAVPVNSGKEGRTIMTNIRAHFDLGRVLGTIGFKSKVKPDEAVVSLTRHATGDWGDLCLEDSRLNDDAVENGGRILSKYVSSSGKSFYIITEADRLVTTCLLVEEY